MFVVGVICAETSAHSASLREAFGHRRKLGLAKPQEDRVYGEVRRRRVETAAIATRPVATRRMLAGSGVTTVLMNCV